jgi:hypothetical protein
MQYCLGGYAMNVVIPAWRRLPLADCVEKVHGTSITGANQPGKTELVEYQFEHGLISASSLPTFEHDERAGDFFKTIGASRPMRRLRRSASIDRFRQANL